MPAPSKAPARVAGMFDAIAGRYDALNHLLSAGLDRRWRRQAIRALQLTGTEHVLDVCTGTADLALAACGARPPAASVLGVDFAGEMLRVGRRKLAQRGEQRIVLVQGDATRMPVPDAAVDAVMAAFGIRNVEQTEAACAEMFRVLAPGGRLAVLEFSIPTAPMVRAIYLWYFQHVLPRLGGLVSGHGSAYGYLPASVSTFATPDEFAAMLRAVGFTGVRAQALTFGIVFLFTARRA